MTHMKTVVVPASTMEMVDYMTCDLCGGRMVEREWHGSHEERVEVQHTLGARMWFVDLCGGCFTSKLAPWLAGQGCALREYSWEG